MSDHQPSEAAKQALGVRLRDLRLDVGLSAAALAARTGFSASKISRSESGKTRLSEADIRTWVLACGAEGRLPELIAASREVDSMWLEYRRRLKLGQAAIQAQGLSEFEGVKLARIYESLHVPGILQTFEYARTQRLIWARLHGLSVHDVDIAARNRLTMQPLVTEGGGPAFSFVLEATVLYNVIGGADAMAEQLDFLSSLVAAGPRRPHVAVGIIPLGATRKLFPGEGFYLFDDRKVWQEFWSGVLQTSQPTDLTYFGKVFDHQQRHAVYGDAAQQEIQAAKNFVQGRATP
ncbi:helix-turn-helix domain-containing protein [Actinomadura craniellae]|uniref:helix-turn-helix domain-containing protein n=1 Tax=Actinomadura craniellae TaxID=2231787 RepID=UPI001F330B58|nr:helix-turn-helix transcriptional regulator [Actinomadura craniellae]